MHNTHSQEIDLPNASVPSSHGWGKQLHVAEDCAARERGGLSSIWWIDLREKQGMVGVGVCFMQDFPYKAATDWHDEPADGLWQVYNFVGTPGSGDQSPVSLSGELSPSMVPQISPSPSPGVATPTSPLQNSQHRLSWSVGHAEKKKDKERSVAEMFGTFFSFFLNVHMHVLLNLDSHISIGLSMSLFTQMHASSHTFMYMCTHTQTHTNTHTHTYTYTHMY